MSLSNGQLAQMEAAAIHRQEDKEHLLLEQEIMGKWARGELVPVIRCKDCIHNAVDKSKGGHGYYCKRHGVWGNNGSSFYCADGERKGKDNG